VGAYFLTNSLCSTGRKCSCLGKISGSAWALLGFEGLDQKNSISNITNSLVILPLDKVVELLSSPKKVTAAPEVFICSSTCFYVYEKIEIL